MAKTLEEIEQDLKAVSDNVGRLMDQVAKKGFAPFFQCGHSGLFYPGDYVKQWGKLYGIGLGPEPVSECLDSDYDSAPPPITPDIRSIDQIMHPLHTTRSQVDLVLLDPREVEGKLLVVAEEDRYLEKRSLILRQKQLANPNSRLRNLVASWKEAK